MYYDDSIGEAFVTACGSVQHNTTPELEPINMNKMNESVVKEVNDRVFALRVIQMAISRQM